MSVSLQDEEEEPRHVKRKARRMDEARAARASDRVGRLDSNLLSKAQWPSLPSKRSMVLRESASEWSVGEEGSCFELRVVH